MKSYVFQIFPTLKLFAFYPIRIRFFFMSLQTFEVEKSETVQDQA